MVTNRNEILRLIVLLTVSAPLLAQDSRPATARLDLDAEFARVMPGNDEARWTAVPWLHSLSAARAESVRTQKPIYLFVNDGEVGSGRC